jgi:hypothetical protein
MNEYFSEVISLPHYEQTGITSIKGPFLSQCYVHMTFSGNNKWYGEHEQRIARNYEERGVIFWYNVLFLGYV